jgi:Fic family protein
MEESMDRLEAYLNRPSKLPPLVRLALIHYQFEAIHPFRDGNGRVGRLMITLMLCMDKILPGPLLYLSDFFERYRRDYYDLLLAVSTRGAWPEWIKFFLRGATDSARDAVTRASRLIDLREDYRRALHSTRSSALPLQLVDELFSTPALTVAQAARLLNITVTAAQNNIDKLVNAGVLREVTGQKRNRIYIADSIMHVAGDESID